MKRAARARAEQLATTASGDLQLEAKLAVRTTAGTVVVVVVRAVTFDADGTLWDFDTAMRGALDQVVTAAVTACPELAGRLSTLDLQAIAQRLFDEAGAMTAPRTPLATLRRRSFHVALTRLGVDDPVLADSLADRYFLHWHGDIELFPGTADVLERIAQQYPLGLITNGNTDPGRSGLAGRFAFHLSADAIGIAKPDPRLFHMAAAAAGCRIDEIVHVGDRVDKDVTAAQHAGARAVWFDATGGARSPHAHPDATITSLGELPAVLTAFDAFDAERNGSSDVVGVGPHPLPWPEDLRLDPVLLAEGDRRNVVDRYRYWRIDAVVADLDERRHPFHVAIENWHHDLNIGTVVRNANAFMAMCVHIVGRRRWNRRGAMVTDRYQHVHHHATIQAFVEWAEAEHLPIIAIDNLPEAAPLDRAALPHRCILLFGQEGPGLSVGARDAATAVYGIRQFGSTRSINAGVASGIAMHTWIRQHAPAHADDSPGR